MPPLLVPQKIKFRRLSGIYSIVRLAHGAPVPDWAANGVLTSITRTPDELSIVCPADDVPEEVDPGPPWICMKLEGPFSFSQTGILVSFIEPLSSNAIPIFAVSTYDTDYVFIQEQFTDRALKALQAAGHELVSV